MWNPLAWAQIVPIPDPAVGGAAIHRIPGETFERIESIRFRYVASAAVANRFLSVEITGGDGESLAMIEGATAIVAGQTVRATFIRGIATVLAGGANEQLLPLPDIMYPPGCRVTISAANIDVSDQISLVHAVISRYPSGKSVESRGSTPYHE